MARSPEDLAESISALGRLDGREVMVHASLRRLGPVDGGAEGVLQGLRIALGPSGTMLMVLAADDDEPFDRLTSPADPDVGTLAEVFRQHPDAAVNDNPACRFGAWGPAAAALLEPQPVDDYYGPGSPLARQTEHGGAVLRLGADIDTVTLTHHAEYLADVPDKQRAQRTYVRADVGEVLIESLDDTDGIAEWPPGDYFSQILRDFIADGHAVVGPVGGCTAELLEARRFVEFATSWMETHLG